MKLHSVNAGFFKLDGGAMHGVVPKTMWNKVHPADENNMCTWAMRSILIEHDGYLILVDTGMGNKQSEKFFGYYDYPLGPVNLKDSLAATGNTYEDITDIFLTHLHFDHVGGAIVRNEEEELVPAFANARYWSNKKHWKNAKNPNQREKASFLPENILPIETNGKLNFLETYDGGEWIPGINVRYVNGHTDSMMLPQIKYKNTTLFFCGDLIPSAAHIAMPWIIAYDMCPIDTLKEKEQILKEAAEQNWVLFFQHDAEIECATVHQTEKGIQLKETFKLSELDEKI